MIENYKGKVRISKIYYLFRFKIEELSEPVGANNPFFRMGRAQQDIEHFKKLYR